MKFYHLMCTHGQCHFCSVNPNSLSCSQWAPYLLLHLPLWCHSQIPDTVVKWIQVLSLIRSEDEKEAKAWSTVPNACTEKHTHTHTGLWLTDCREGRRWGATWDLALRLPGILKGFYKIMECFSLKIRVMLRAETELKLSTGVVKNALLQLLTLIQLYPQVGSVV